MCQHQWIFDSGDERFTLTNGLSNDGAGIKVDVGQPVLLDNLYIRGNQSTGNGGGISIRGEGKVVINACRIYRNECVSSGGGIVNSGDNVIIQNSLIYRNETLTDGGGLNTTGRLKLINSTVAFNVIPSGRYGGAKVIATGLDSLLLMNSVFYGNTGSWGHLVLDDLQLP